MTGFVSSQNNKPSSNGPHFMSQLNPGVSVNQTSSFAPWVHVLLELLKPSTLHAPGTSDNNTSEFKQAPQRSFAPREFVP